MPWPGAWNVPDYEGKVLNQNGFTELWIQIIEEDLDFYNPRRIRIKMGYINNDTALEYPGAEAGIYNNHLVYTKTLRPKHNISYIGFGCGWEQGSMDFEILNGMSQNDKYYLLIIS